MNSHQVVVVGAGPAGCAAAIEAAGLGLSVLLIDEHPQSTEAMGLDAPYFYGSRLPARLSDASAVADAVLGSNEALMDCLESGVEVLTGTCVWGIFGPDAGDPLTRGRQIGLADEERSWIDGYEYLILASGARDLVLSFPNWHLPGVLGVKGAATLLDRYGVLGGSELLILGSGNAGLSLARRALDAGVRIAGIVEPTATVLGDKALADEIRGSGVPFFLAHTIETALGTTEVSGARLRPIDSNGRLSSEAVEVPCDTICMAYATVPNIELASVARCEMEFDPARSGWSPRLSDEMETSVERIYVVGDAAGVSDAAILDDEVVRRQGRVAARAIATNAGLLEHEPPTGHAAPIVESTVYPPRAWLETLLQAGGFDVMLCQCEEVTRGELLRVIPPRYLDAADHAPAAGLKSLTPHGRTSQDLLKRLTRVGMGHCQGRRCRDQSLMLLAREAGVEISDVSPASYRVPVRPLSVNILSAAEEDPELRARWSYWLHETDGVPEA